MASVIDAFNEAFADNLSIIKFAVYAIPVYFCAQYFIKGQMNEFYILASFTAILLLGMMTCAINNVRENRQEVITLNPLRLVWVTAKTAVAILPVVAVFGGIGYILTKYVGEYLPEELGGINLTAKIVIWGILGAVILTSYLSYAKFLSIKQAYNVSAIADSCIDVLINLVVFFLPQMAIANVILMAPIYYVFYFFHISMDHWSFVVYTSIVFIANISITSNYFAQAAYEIIKGKDGDYDNKHDLSLLDVDDTEKANL